MRLDEVKIVTEAVNDCKFYRDGMCVSGCKEANVVKMNVCKYEDEQNDCPCYK